MQGGEAYAGVGRGWGGGGGAYQRPAITDVEGVASAVGLEGLVVQCVSWGDEQAAQGAITVEQLAGDVCHLQARMHVVDRVLPVLLGRRCAAVQQRQHVLLPEVTSGADCNAPEQRALLRAAPLPNAMLRRAPQQHALKLDDGPLLEAAALCREPRECLVEALLTAQRLVRPQRPLSADLRSTRRALSLCRGQCLDVPLLIRVLGVLLVVPRLLRAKEAGSPLAAWLGLGLGLAA